MNCIFPWEAATGLFFTGMVAGLGLALMVVSIAAWIRARRVNAPRRKYSRTASAFVERPCDWKEADQ